MFSMAITGRESFAVLMQTRIRRLASSLQELKERIPKMEPPKPYTAEIVQASLAIKVDTYFARLSVSQPPTWKCDQRTKELFCIYAWLMDELTLLKGSNKDRRAMQWYFNRKSRAEDDLFALAAKVMNDYLAGNIDCYHGK